MTELHGTRGTLTVGDGPALPIESWSVTTPPPTLEEVLWDAFEADPFDALNAAVLADWLEDAGEDALASAVRWMQRERKRPLRDRTMIGGNQLRFWNEAVASSYDPESNLPAAVCAHLGQVAGFGETFVAIHDTFRGAVINLAQALTKQEAQ